MYSHFIHVQDCIHCNLNQFYHLKWTFDVLKPNINYGANPLCSMSQNVPKCVLLCWKGPIWHEISLLTHYSHTNSSGPASKSLGNYSQAKMWVLVQLGSKIVAQYKKKLPIWWILPVLITLNTVLNMYKMWIHQAIGVPEYPKMSQNVPEYEYIKL